MDIEIPAVSPASLVTLPMLPNSGGNDMTILCSEGLHNKISSTGHFAPGYKTVLLTSMYLLNQGKWTSHLRHVIQLSCVKVFKNT